MMDLWIVLGDFNAILFVHDRVNGLPVKQSETKDIQNCIQEIGLGQINRKDVPTLGAIR